MYDQTKNFDDRFWETVVDVVVRKTFEIAISLAEATVLIGGFRYAGVKLQIPALNIAYWILLVSLSAYVGNRSSYLLSGLVRGRKVWKRWHDFVIYPAGIVIAAGTMYAIRWLIDAVVLSQALQAV